MSEHIAPFYYGSKSRKIVDVVYSDNFGFAMFLLFGVGGVVATLGAIGCMLIFSPIFAWLFLIPGVGAAYFLSASKFWNNTAGYDQVMNRYNRLPEETRKKLKPLAIDYADKNFTGNNVDFQNLVNGYFALLSDENSERNRELIPKLYEDLEIKKDDADSFAQAKREAEAARQKARDEVAAINRNVINAVKAKA